MTFDTSLGIDSAPGMGAVVEQKVREYKRDGGAWQRLEGVQVDKNTVDAGSSPTTNLRPGLVLLKSAVSGRWVQAGHADAPASGSLTLVGILDHYLELRDKTGTVQHTMAAVLIAGFVYDAQIIYVDGSYKTAVQAALKLVDFR